MYLSWGVLILDAMMLPLVLLAYSKIMFPFVLDLYFNNRPFYNRALPQFNRTVFIFVMNAADFEGCKIFAEVFKIHKEKTIVGLIVSQKFS